MDYININSIKTIDFNTFYVQSIQSTNRMIIEVISGKRNITNNHLFIKGDVTLVSDAESNSLITNCNFKFYTFNIVLYISDCDSCDVSYNVIYDELLHIVTRIYQTNFTKVFSKTDQILYFHFDQVTKIMTFLIITKFMMHVLY